MIPRTDRHALSPPKSSSPLPLELISVGRSFWAPGAFYERKKASRLGMELVIRGGVELNQNGRQYKAQCGDLFLLHRDSRHRYQSISSYPKTLKRFVVISGTALDSLLKSLGLEDTAVIPIQHPSKMESYFRELWLCCEKDQGGQAHRASSLLYSMLMEAHRHLPRTGDDRLAPVLRYMQLNLHQSLNRHDLAKVAKMSYPHLNRLFRNEINQSPVNYFESLRMERARFYLLDTSWSIQEVARQLGYSNPLYFSTRYRHHHGVSPREHRKTKGT